MVKDFKDFFILSENAFTFLGFKKRRRKQKGAKLKKKQKNNFLKRGRKN